MEKYGEDWPMGKVRELESRKETLPAVEVKNRVIDVNENFPKLPMGLREGESTRLGMFLTPQIAEGEASYPLEIEKRHSRSGLWGRMLFKDKDGNLYRDIDLKGIGATTERNGAIVVDDAPEGYRYTEMPHGTKINLGIIDLFAAARDKEKSEELLKLGVRTHREIAIIELDEIVDPKGRKISIEEAKRVGLIWPDSKPVVEVRAFGTKARLAGAKEDPLSVEDARLLVANENNFDPEKFSKKEYAKWLLEATGRNLGLMHKNGLVHGFMTRHNITLDGRLVDFDSVRRGGGEEEFQKDIDDATFALNKFLEAVGEFSDEGIDSFKKAYEKARK